MPFERSAAKLKHDSDDDDDDDDDNGGGRKANETIPADLPGMDEELVTLLPSPPLEERSRRWTDGRLLPPANLVAIDDDDEEDEGEYSSTSSRRRHNSGTISFSRPSSSPVISLIVHVAPC
jgi:hypothetical protein